MRLIIDLDITRNSGGVDDETGCVLVPPHHGILQNTGRELRSRRYCSRKRDPT